MSNLLEYKGYTASIEFSAEDRIFYGKLEMINDLVTFEANTVETLEKEFYLAVDDYLETSEKLKRNPEKMFKGVFNIRISPLLHKKLYLKAKSEKKSLNKVVEDTLEKSV